MPIQQNSFTGAGIERDPSSYRIDPDQTTARGSSRRDEGLSGGTSGTTFGASAIELARTSTRRNVSSHARVSETVQPMQMVSPDILRPDLMAYYRTSTMRFTPAVGGPPPSPPPLPSLEEMTRLPSLKKRDDVDLMRMMQNDKYQPKIQFEFTPPESVLTKEVNEDIRRLNKSKELEKTKLSLDSILQNAKRDSLKQSADRSRQFKELLDAMPPLEAFIKHDDQVPVDDVARMEQQEAQIYRIPPHSQIPNPPPPDIRGRPPEPEYRMGSATGGAAAQATFIQQTVDEEAHNKCCIIS